MSDDDRKKLLDDYGEILQRQHQRAAAEGAGGKPETKIDANSAALEGEPPRRSKAIKRRSR